MRKFEYAVHERPIPIFTDDRIKEKLYLDEQGSGGWELVAVTIFAGTVGHPKWVYQYYWKRLE